MSISKAASRGRRADPERVKLPGLHPAALIGGYVVIALVPLILAAMQRRPPHSFWRELSSGLVMVGFVALLLQFLLSGRFRQISGRIGIDAVMRFHQLIAWSALAFVIAHPLLYAVPRLVTGGFGDAMASLSRMFGSPALRTGVIAWVLLLLLVPLAAWRDSLPARYELWRFSHGAGAVAIAVLGLNHTLRVGTYSDGALLAGFWVFLTAAAVLSVAHVYLLKPLLQLFAPWRVVANRKVADRTWEIAIEPENGAAPRFGAGQFVWLKLGHGPFSLVEHPFSISSAPADRPRLAFTIKESGDFTSRIGEIAPGTRAYIDGPHGTFTLVGHRPRPVVFIAGGVGFAPVIGILRQLARERYPHPVRLIYGNRVETQILYRDEIEGFGQVLDFRADLVLSEPPPGWTGRTGQLTPDTLLDCLQDAPREAIYFVCGPVPMMDVVESTLVNMGIPADSVVLERFRYA